MEISRQHSVLVMGDILENVRPLIIARRTVSHFQDHVAFKVFAVREGQKTKQNLPNQTCQNSPNQISPKLPHVDSVHFTYPIDKLPINNNVAKPGHFPWMVSFVYQVIISHKIFNAYYLVIIVITQIIFVSKLVIIIFQMIFCNKTKSKVIYLSKQIIITSYIISVSKMVIKISQVMFVS